MHIDPKKMKAARDRRALTQEALAHQARVNVRTIQRAESGQPLHAETVAEIAAVLGVPASGLIRTDPTKEPEVQALEDGEEQTQVLKRVDRGELVISSLERSAMAVLGCTAEPTKEALGSLKELLSVLEPLILNPWVWPDIPPLRFDSILERLETVGKLNAGIVEIERTGNALFMATSTELVKVPSYHQDEGVMATWTNQKPTYERATRLHIAEYSAERIRVSADAIWPLEVHEEVDDLDEDIPF